jgi:uncharacterized membrane protein
MRDQIMTGSRGPALARVWAGALVAGLVLGGMLELTAFLFAVTHVGARWSGVVELFYRAAGALLGGYLNQTSFLSLYPPLSLVALAPPRLIAPDLGIFAFLLGLEMSIAAGAGLVLVIRMKGWREFGQMNPAATYAAFILLGAFVLPSTFDILPGVLTLGAVAAAVQRRGWLAGALLGLAFALKLYAIVLLPALVLWYWFGGLRRQAATAITGFAIAGLVGLSLYIPLAASPADLARSLSDRGLQIESVGGSLVSFAAASGFAPSPSVVYTGSFDLAGGAAAAALRVLTLAAPLLLLGVLASSAWGLRRSKDTHSAEGLLLAFTASLLAVLVSSKVFSPQYMLWLVPVVPFLSRPKRALLLVAMALTAVVFPFVYDGVLKLEVIPTTLLLLRNLLLVALLSWIVADLLGIRIPSRESLRIPSERRFPSEIGR